MLLTEIEAVFRSLRSELGLRPIDLHQERCTDGHLLISVIAYQTIQVRRTRMAQLGVTASWATIRNSLQTVSRITTTFDRPDGRSCIGARPRCQMPIKPPSIMRCRSRRRAVTQKIPKIAVCSTIDFFTSLITCYFVKRMLNLGTVSR